MKQHLQRIAPERCYVTRDFGTITTEGFIDWTLYAQLSHLSQRTLLIKAERALSHGDESVECAMVLQILDGLSYETNLESIRKRLS